MKNLASKFQLVFS